MHMFCNMVIDFGMVWMQFITIGASFVMPWVMHALYLLGSIAYAPTYVYSDQCLLPCRARVLLQHH